MNEPIDLLRRHFGLTPAEARLALHLVAGETLRSAEVKLNITYESARTSLKNIFRKTGTCRQAELVIVWPLEDPIPYICPYARPNCGYRCHCLGLRCSLDGCY